MSKLRFGFTAEEALQEARSSTPVKEKVHSKAGLWRPASTSAHAQDGSSDTFATPMQPDSEGGSVGAVGTPARPKTSQIGHNLVATPQGKSGTEVKKPDSTGEAQVKWDSTTVFDPVVGGRRARADSDVWYDATTGALPKDGTSQASETNRLHEPTEGEAEVNTNGLPRPPRPIIDPGHLESLLKFGDCESHPASTNSLEYRIFRAEEMYRKLTANCHIDERLRSHMIETFEKDRKVMVGDYNALTTTLVEHCESLHCSHKTAKEDISHLGADIGHLGADLSRIRADLSRLDTAVGRLEIIFPQYKMTMERIVAQNHELKTDLEELKMQRSESEARETVAVADWFTHKEEMRRLKALTEQLYNAVVRSGYAPQGA